MFTVITRCFLLVLAAFLVAPAPSRSQVRVDPRLPQYVAVGAVSGSLVAIGSDSMNNVMSLWFEEFQKHHRTVRVEIRGKGASTAFYGLIEEVSNVGMTTRDFRPNEIEQFRKKFGGPPVVVSVGCDALAVFVYKDNPIEALTFKQVDAIFSKTRKRGHGENITTWGQLGLGGK